jgi:general transcription factor 3C polypeptide 5 (transcription factor C subunit 1)
MREFKFDPRRGWRPNEEIIQPPNMSMFPLPFYWGCQQNPHITEQIDPETGKTILVNVSKLERLRVEYLPHYMENIPEEPPQEPPDDRELLEVIEKLLELYEERPIWTRRALINRVNYALTEATMHLIKCALPYVGYRFKDGPFRDAIIRFGIDPRKDPKYRMYQTIYFQLAERDVKDPGAQWAGIRKSTKTPKTAKRANDKLSHFFDGRDVAIDGKIWQMCDVTDPLLSKLIKEAPVSETFEPKNDGWYCNGTLAKIRAIMKVKIIALHTGRVVKDEDFRRALDMPDIIPDRENKQIWIPVPDIRLSKEEMENLRAAGKDFTIMSGMLKQKRAYVGRLRHSRRNLDDAPEWSLGPSRPSDPQQRKTYNMATGIQKLASVEEDESRRPSSVESIDPRLLADHVSGVSIGEDGDVDIRDYGGYDDDGMRDSDVDIDRSRGSFETAHSETDDETREGGEGEDGSEDRQRGGDNDAESIDLVEYHGSPSDLVQSVEGDGPDEN